MTWSELHSQSEKAAIEAHLALKNRDADIAARLFGQAAFLEKKALEALDSSKNRTRGITAVSAVALFFKAFEYDQAEQLAYSMLADGSIPSFSRESLRDLVQAIWTESSKRKANVQFIPGQVTVSVKGGEVVTGGAPLDLIVDKVQTIQSMFYRTIEFINGVAHRRSGRPSKDIQDSCRPWLFQSAPGSYQFSVAIQKPKQPDFFKEDIEPAMIAQRFLEIVSASTGDTAEKMESIVPDELYRKTFLKLSRSLAPIGDSFSQIEFRSSGEANPVSLDFESRIKINQQLHPKTNEIVVSEDVPEDITGILRAVDLDKDYIDVLVNGESMRISGLQETVDDVIGPMVNRLVVVQTMRTVAKKHRFIDIDLAVP